MAAVSIAVLLVFLLASVIRSQILARQIAALKAEAARVLEDDDELLAQIETAAATGSGLAIRLLNKQQRPELPPAQEVITAADSRSATARLATHD